MHTFFRVVIASALLCVFAAGCSEELEGASPEVAPPREGASPPSVDPPLVCRDQLTTNVTVRGTGFSPVPIDVPDAPKAALPSITLTRSQALDGADLTDPDQIVYSGNPDPKTNPTNVKHLSWQSQKEMTFIVNQSLTLGEAMKGMLDEGVWDVEVENANGNLVQSPGALAVVDKPTIEKLTPGIVCLEQGYQQIEIQGLTFLRNGKKEPVLEVAEVDDSFEVELSECTSIAHKGIDAEVCDRASVVLGEDSIEPGFPTLTFQNPETAACHSVEDVKLRVVPAPVFDRVDPPMGCVTEEDRTFVIHGGDFLSIDADGEGGEAPVLPVITVGERDFVPEKLGGCEDLATQGAVVERCDSLTFTVKKGELTPDLYEVLVTNPAPAACDVTAKGALRIVPPPTIEDIQPALVCVDDSEQSVVVTGKDFLMVDGERPGVALDGEPLPPKAVAADDCNDLEVDGLDVRRCATLIVTIAKNGVAVGTPEVEVTNPDPAGCSDTRADLLRVAAGPVIEKAEPALVCSEDGMRDITITGTGFLRVDDEVPDVRIDSMPVAAVKSLGGCKDVAVHGLDVERCTEVVVTVDEGALAEDSHPEVHLTNPDPAGCDTTTSDVISVPPFLEITSVEPINVCVGKVDAAFPIHLDGTGFLTSDDVAFELMVGGVVAAVAVTGCEDLEVPGAKKGVFQSCTGIDATIDLTAGMTADAMIDIPIQISNATVAPGCPLAADTFMNDPLVPAVINVVEPPTVTGIDILEQDDNDNVCSDDEFVVQIVGTGFVAGATAKFVNDSMEIMADDIDVLGPTLVEATFSSGLPYDKDDPFFDLVVENAGDCASDPFVDAVEVNPTPLVFFVDPRVVYNEIAIDATIFTSGLSVDSALDTLELIGPEPAMTSAVLTASSAPGKPNRLIAQIPGLDGSMNPTFAAGEYTVKVTSTLGCAGELPGGLTVTDTTDDTLLTSVAPNYVSPTKSTAVTITGAGFTLGPRLYLTPAGVGSAEALRAVEVKSATQITAIVPDGLDAGEYYLVLVSAAGEVDVLGDDIGETGVTVTAGEPPVIDSVVPASLAAGATGALTLTGDGFDPGGVEVVLDCLLPGGGMTRVIVAGTGESVNGAGTSATVSVDLSNGVPLDPGAGSVCVVRLTNGDGASFDYSAFSVTNSSLNLSQWVPSTALSTGRRAPALAAGRPTAVSRFLYAIGGDAGAMNLPFNRGALRPSVEAASVDTFGVMSAWSFQRNDLDAVVVADGAPAPQHRTQAGVARIGRFLYVVGGHDGTNATDTLLRAEVLDPLATSEVEDLDAELGDLDQPSGTLGLGEGLYYYRVAAVFPGNDPSNPGGESLPGEALPVDLPPRPEGIVLTLRWQEISGAHGYRVYRSPAAGDGVDAVELLGEVVCGPSPTDTCDCDMDATQCQFTDDGTGTTDPADTPMPEGSTGVWHAVDGAVRCESANCALGTAREGLVSVAVKDRGEMVPETDTWYLYAFGGRDAANAYQSSGEVARVTVTLADGTQTVSDWTSVNAFISPRADLAAWVMSAENSALIRGSGAPNAVWIYVGGGRTTGDSLADGSIAAALVQSDGTLGTWIQDADANGLAGLGAGMSNDQLYTFGGDPSGGGTSTALCSSPAASGGGGCSGGITDPPDLQNFNSLGNAQTDRMFMGYTQESAFFFLVGGHDGVNTLATTQKTVQ